MRQLSPSICKVVFFTKKKSLLTYLARYYFQISSQLLDAAEVECALSRVHLKLARFNDAEKTLQAVREILILYWGSLLILCIGSPVVHQRGR